MHQDFIFTIAPLVTWILAAAGTHLLDQSRFQVRGIVAPFFVALAIIFALFASLLASEVWHKAGLIKIEMTKEVSALRSIHRLATALQLQNDLVKDKLENYVQALISEQAARSRSDINGKESNERKASAALDDLYHVAVSSERVRSNAPINTIFLTELVKLRDARLQRISLEDSRAAPIKIAALLLFGFITQLAIGLCHSGNTRAAYWSIGLFSIGFSLAVGIITWFDKPVNASHLVFADLASKLWMTPK